MDPDRTAPPPLASEVPAQRSTEEQLVVSGTANAAADEIDEPLQRAIDLLGGVTTVLVEIVARLAAGPATGQVESVSAVEAVPATDILIGAGTGLVRLAGDAIGFLSKVTRPVSSAILHPPGIPERFSPAKQLQDLAELGRRDWSAAEQSGSEALRVLVPTVADWVLDRLDLRAVVARIDLNDAVRTVDVNAIAERVDLRPLLDRAPIERVLDRADVDGVADRLDLDRVIKRIDVDAVVAAVDLDAVAARLDLDAIVNRVDIVALAREVVDALDLPEIIRSSTGAMTSDAVRGVRAHSMHADDTVAHVAERFLWRRRSGRHESDESASAGGGYGHDDLDE
jgi:hypothetical protein